MKHLYFYFWLIVFLTGSAMINSIRAQISVDAIPSSFSRAIPPEEDNVFLVPAPELSSIEAEDRIHPVPFRFAVNVPVDLGINDLKSGKFPDGTTEIWRMTIHAPGAQGLTLYFDRFHLMPGARLFVYNPSRTLLLGAYTDLNNNDLSTFATSLVSGDRLTIEYNAPAGTTLPELHISEIAWAYRGVLNHDGIRTGFGASGDCEVNPVCEEGTDWQRQKRGVTRIQIKRGLSTLFCTGSLVNNTKNDGTPYVLTADHCGRLSTDADLSQWIFYFNYESATCDNPAKEPALNSITGAKKIASGGESGTNGSDFYLVLMNSKVPAAWNAYFNGWSRETTPSSSGVTIHHPQGDIKKISTYTKPLQPAYWSGDAVLAHWRVTWSPTVNGHGATELGSSGSPLFDFRGRIVGTLTGGDSSCDSTALTLPDYYGMFSYHWDKNGSDSARQLKPWLDPIDVNVMNINGWALSTDDKELAYTADLFPNPVNDVLTVRLHDRNHAGFQLRILDMVGNVRNVRYIEPSAGTITIGTTSLAPGMYFLMLKNQNGEVARKFIKI